MEERTSRDYRSKSEGKYNSELLMAMDSGMNEESIIDSNGWREEQGEIIDQNEGKYNTSELWIARDNGMNKNQL